MNPIAVISSQITEEKDLNFRRGTSGERATPGRVEDEPGKS